ncbi:TolB family protein [Nocardioides speluncae]|uniref:TolB family protein n=1 Tax=Nocardioides speluncae TaxID=2670337 RepID=UPI001379C998|nr:PD40 domain-containing protein [Nocardioides speluncae]
MIRQIGIIATLAGAVLTAVGPVGALSVKPPFTERVSVATSGAQANNGITSEPAISRTGRYVAFHSQAKSLVAGDTNAAYDVFVRDRRTGSTTRVSVASDGSEGNRDSLQPSISADGRYVAFRSLAGNLVKGYTDRCHGPCWESYVHDRRSGRTQRVSVDSDGREGDGHSAGRPSISPDGRYVAFTSDARNLVADDGNGLEDAFLHNRRTGRTVRVSLSYKGAEADGHSFTPVVSRGGQYVAFTSLASNLTPGIGNGTRNVFLLDRAAGSLTRLSVARDGTDADALSERPSISVSGRYVAFSSRATNLVAGDHNGLGDVFVYDRVAATTTRASVADDEAESEAASLTSIVGTLSADARYVAFSSTAGNLVPGDTNGRSDIFVRDLRRGTTIRVSVGDKGAQGNGASGTHCLSSDGRHVAFGSLATNLVPGDTNTAWDVFVGRTG